MKLTLFDINQDLISLWEHYFRIYPEVEVLHCPLEQLSPHQYLVTAGNSFGIMDGGIDLAVRRFFGFGIQDKVQWGIVKQYGGPIPIGHTLTIETGHPLFPYLIYAPTMHTPEMISRGNILSVTEAIFRNHPGARTIACCGLGSLTGKVPLSEVAYMMRLAYENIYRPESIS